MAFIVEDGTARSDSNSYISLADAESLVTDYGSNAAWAAATDQDKQSALLQATSYIDSNYAFAGTVVLDSQVLRWPRYSAYDDENRLIASDIVPLQVERATVELAQEHLVSHLDSALTRNNVTKRKKVGTLELEYFEGAPVENRYPAVDKLLRPFTTFATSSIISMGRVDRG